MNVKKRVSFTPDQIKQLQSVVRRVAYARGCEVDNDYDKKIWLPKEQQEFMKELDTLLEKASYIYLSVDTQ